MTRFLSYKAALLDGASVAAVRWHAPLARALPHRRSDHGVLWWARHAQQKLEAIGLAHSTEAVKGALNALVFIFRSVNHLPFCPPVLQA